VVHAFFEPGLFGNQPVRTAAAACAVASVVSGVIGVFTVIRGQSFAGHALADVTATGGSAALLVGINPLWGFVGMGLAAAGGMELSGVQRARGRDVATGIVLGAALGLAALFLYLDTTWRSTGGATASILFGSMFTLSPATVPIVAVVGAATLAGALVIYRPLLLSSVDSDLAAARGLPVRVVGVAFLCMVAVAVALSAVTIGAILSTALLIGPAAAALRLTKRTGAAMVTAAAIGLGASWLGIVLAYDSYAWPPDGHGWPASFFIVALVFGAYLMADLPGRWRDRRAGARTAADRPGDPRPGLEGAAIEADAGAGPDPSHAAPIGSGDGRSSPGGL